MKPEDKVRKKEGLHGTFLPGRGKNLHVNSCVRNVQLFEASVMKVGKLSNVFTSTEIQYFQMRAKLKHIRPSTQQKKCKNEGKDQ